MSWDDFTACAGRDGEILAEVGRGRGQGDRWLWQSLPQDVKGMLIAAAR